MRVTAMTLPASLLLAGSVWAQSALPNPTLTPGAVNPMVTQDNVGQTICRPGWTRTVRPPARYTSALKRRQIRQYGYPDRRLRLYEEDHLIPLSLGGAPTDPRNLWPEPRQSADGWDADRKDELEAVLPQLICARKLGLQDAQQAIATNWIDAYRRYVGE